MQLHTSCLSVRGLNYHISEWGCDNAEKLFLLHGWGDCALTFRHLMPVLTAQFHVIAPDWRGFGNTEHATDSYWFPDYFADLEVILHHFSPHQAVNLVGHSMGGNIACLYAGIRPERVQKLMTLEGIGLPAGTSAEAVEKYRRWMAQAINDEPAKIYPDKKALKLALHKGNPRLDEPLIDELVEAWAEPYGGEGAFRLKQDVKHRYANPVRYSYADTREIWRQVKAKSALLIADQSSILAFIKNTSRLDELKSDLRIADQHDYRIEDCGHMVHLEKPDQTANMMLDFFTTS